MRITIENAKVKYKSKLQKQIAKAKIHKKGPENRLKFSGPLILVKNTTFLKTLRF